MVKKILLSVTMVLLLTLLPTATAFADDEGGSIYLALGDSVPAGVGASDAENGYVPLFNDEIDHDLINLAISGETTASFIGDFPTCVVGGQLCDAFGTILAGDVDVVTLDVGANDLVFDPLFVTAAIICFPGPSPACDTAVGDAFTAFLGRYATIVGALSAAMAGEGTLFVLTAYNPFSGTGHPLEPVAEASLTVLNGIMATVAGIFGATVVDVHAAFDDRALELTHIAMLDPHPNDEGHEVIAELLEDLVDEIDEGDDEGD